MAVSQDIMQLKVRLLGISPMIWRRVVVPVSISLHELHGVLQVAMGWESIHLFAFDIYGVQYGSFELSIGSPRAPLTQFGFRKNDKLSCTYDMGDGWVHEIRVEREPWHVPKQSIGTWEASMSRRAWCRGRQRKGLPVALDARHRGVRLGHGSDEVREQKGLRHPRRSGWSEGPGPTEEQGGKALTEHGIRHYLG